MSDTAIKPTQGHRIEWGSEQQLKNVKRRYAADRRLQLFGLGAISLAVLLLGILVFSLVQTGYKSFVQTKVLVEIPLDHPSIKRDEPGKGSYRVIVRNAFRSNFPEVSGRRDLRNVDRILSSQARFIVRDYVVANPELVGQTIKIALPLSDPFDQLHKKVIPSQIAALSQREKQLFKSLQDRNVVSIENDVTVVQIDAFIDPEKVAAQDLDAGDYEGVVKEGLRSYFLNYQPSSYEPILADNAADAVKNFVQQNPGVVGQTVQVKVPVSEHYDVLNKGSEPFVTNPRFDSAKQIEQYKALNEKNLISTPFNWELFFNSDSRFPEQAGLAGAIVGSFYTLLVCFLISFPVGISAAVYLEEFAPKNRYTDLIEVNINNLAAVPSVVFGLLGLAVFLGFFGMPRSAPLVGGMVLSLMTLPTIIIATRAALKAVPPSVREAALGVGASRHQVVIHHVLPLAMPGILTGTIIGLAQALGETAPLLLIGMNAFITAAPGGILEPATALPTQIFSWADSPERGFVSRTSAAILVLLGFLVIMNAIAIFMRQRFERSW